MRGSFINDERNIGGRRQISLEMKNHLINLNNSKAVIKIQPARKYMSAKRMRSNEIVLIKNNKAHNFYQSEHIRNLSNLHRRLGKISNGYSLFERQKNPFDPIAHPSLFLRRKEEMFNISKISTKSKKYIMQNSEINMQSATKTATKLYGNIIRKIKTSTRTRANSRSHITFNPENLKENQGFYIDFSNIRSQGDSPIEIKPRTQLGNKIRQEHLNNMYEKYFKSYEENNNEMHYKLKRELLQKIVGKRIYKKEDLDKLLENTMNENLDVKKSKIEEIWAEVMNDLNA